jgi:hypothetical protein
VGSRTGEILRRLQAEHPFPGIGPEHPPWDQSAAANRELRASG